LSRVAVIVKVEHTVAALEDASTSNPGVTIRTNYDRRSNVPFPLAAQANPFFSASFTSGTEKLSSSGPSLPAHRLRIWIIDRSSTVDAERDSVQCRRNERLFGEKQCNSFP
jgi:hypothetical protein